MLLRRRYPPGCRGRSLRRWDAPLRVPSLPRAPDLTAAATPVISGDDLVDINPYGKRPLIILYVVDHRVFSRGLRIGANRNCTCRILL